MFGGMYGLRISEIFGVVEQLPFRIPAGTTIISEMAPTKSNDRILPIIKETQPFFERQLILQKRQKELAGLSGGAYYDNNLVVAKPNGAPFRRESVSSDFGQLIRRMDLPHIRFHDLRHTAATNMHQLTGDFYTVGEILGHTLKGIGISLGISTSLEAVTAQYVDVRLEGGLSQGAAPQFRLTKKKRYMSINSHIVASFFMLFYTFCHHSIHCF